jgi:hypothetical protein
VSFEKLDFLSIFFRNIQFVDTSNSVSLFFAKSLPKELSKRFEILMYFRDQIKNNLIKTDFGNNASGNKRANLPCLNFWVRSEEAIVFMLSDGIFQLNFRKVCGSHFWCI